MTRRQEEGILSDMDLPHPKVNITNIAKVSYEDTKAIRGYKHSDRCIICTAKDEHNMPLRDFFDTFACTSGYKQCQEWLADRGIHVSTKPIISHITKHAPFVLVAKETASKYAQKLIVKIHQEKVQASEAVQKIIDIGSAKIDDGTLPVTERLFIEAIKEEGRRGAKTTMDTEIETMDEDFINKMKSKNEQPT